MENERKELINKLCSMGVSDIHGKNPYKMPINELRTLCTWFENRLTDEKGKK